MKYFIIEGIVTNPEKMNEDIMQAHQTYTQSAMDKGKVLFSSLKGDMSASVTVMKEESEEAVWSFYKKEPFFKNGILTYQISEIQVHYHYPDINEWFGKII